MLLAQTGTQGHPQFTFYALSRPIGLRDTSDSGALVRATCGSIVLACGVVVSQMVQIDILTVKTNYFSLDNYLQPL